MCARRRYPCFSFGPAAQPTERETLPEGLIPLIFRALACDYDGTLATHDQIGPAALEALERARDAGLKLILVTGRTFFELLRVCERLELFDVVVAENGGVVYEPRSGALQDQAPPPPPHLLSELDRRGLGYQRGRVIVGLARQDEAAAPEALAAADVSRDRVYNRAKLMLVPEGISKGTGVRKVIRDLGLSFHDVLALGDAENDLEFFAACGWTACPGDAMALLRERADWVFPGENGASVAGAITGPILSGRLPVHLSPRHRVALGWEMGSAASITIPARGVNILVQGDPLSGKSSLVGAIVERLVAEHYAVCVLDPEGDYRVLGALSGVVCEEVDGVDAMARAVAHFDANPAACVVADLSTLRHPDKVRVIGEGLAMLDKVRRRHGLPHWIVVDEAHYVLHGQGVHAEVLSPDMKGLCLASYRSSWIRPSLTALPDVYVLARTTDPDELGFLRGCFDGLGADGEAIVSALPGLPVGQVGPGRRFIFRTCDGREVGSAENITGFLQALDSVDLASLDWHARRGDFSRWGCDVFSDPELGRQLRKAEQRWVRGELADLVESLTSPIEVRYGV